MAAHPELLNSADGAGRSLDRREALKLAGAALAAGLLAPRGLAAGRSSKKVVVAGAGIAGLCCAYELMQRGHDVVVLEGSDRAGGHVLTTHYADGLYADMGAEQCTDPAYELYRGYVKTFGLTLLPYRRNERMLTYFGGKPYTAEMMADRGVLAKFGLNQREIDFMVAHHWQELRLLYYGPYLDKFVDEYQPFGLGLDDLDNVSSRDFLLREGASAAGLRFGGGGRSSALQEMWRCAILKHRRRPIFDENNVFRIQGGNQRLTDAFAARLGSRVRLNCPVIRIARGDSGVTVHHRELGEAKTIEADYLVNTICVPVFRNIPVDPPWPAEKASLFSHVTYNMQSRIVFRCRTRFWREEGVSPNITPGDPALRHLFECASEVPGERGILMSSCEPGLTGEQSLAALRRYYPGKSIDVDQVLIREWYRETWAPMCERLPFQMGQLAKFWPNLIQPLGRIHFAGAYADNYTSGQEAATRSAERAARLIDAA